MQALSSNDLLALLNWELAAYDQCDGCRFVSIQPSPASDGEAHWRDALVQADHRLGMDEQFIVRHIVAETRRSFDLAGA